MAKKKNTIHVLSVQSESGDDYGPFLFKERISGEQLLEFLKTHTAECEVEDYSGPDEDGCPGWMGTYLHLTWSQQEVH
jgi:hypothetical protein